MIVAENPLHLVTEKCGLQYQTLSLLPSNGNLKKTSYMTKIHNYVF